MRVIATDGLPIKVWGERIDEAAMAQARNLAMLPFAHAWIALMPDAHVGFGMPIGGVLATRGEVIPHAVGLDIGCGVCACRTEIRADDVMPERDRVLAAIRATVPQGFEWHHTSQEHRTDLFRDVPASAPLAAQLIRAKRQIGTLGGGNHFIELQRDADGVLWVMLHSGSRNLGKQMAEHYDALARRENERTASPVPPEWGLAHLPVASAAGAEYLAVMRFCMEFARENRRLILASVLDALGSLYPGMRSDALIDVHHNYAAIEMHEGTEVVVHRKGAVRAEGTVVIPGSMGTHSYVARGLANSESFRSCSHGAGRVMGRRQAKREIPAAEVFAEMRDKDISLAAADQKGIAEEAAAAYKDIEDVMAWQRDLVEPTTRLEPVAVLKG